MTLASDLMRVQPDDPWYVAKARAEAAHWSSVQVGSMESNEAAWLGGPFNEHKNLRYTDDADTPWWETIPRYGTFGRGLVLGTSALTIERRILAANPGLSATFVDIAPGALTRRTEMFGAEFPGRVDTLVADFNFLELEPRTFDLIVSSACIHHVTNLERLAFTINEALTDDGFFFLEDFAGEPRMQYSDRKKRVFEVLHDREVARVPGRLTGLTWRDDSDLSPLCSLRSDEIFPVMRQYLEEVLYRTDGPFAGALVRSTGPGFAPGYRANASQRITNLRERFLRRLGFKRPLRIREEFLREMFLVGDVLCDAGVLVPDAAFGVYGKKT